MSHAISVRGSGITFPCEPGETLLDAAERSGFALPYSCRKGVCSTCKGGLVSGRLATGQNSHVSGPRGEVLYCIARAETDVEIAPKWIVERRTPERRRYHAAVHRIDRPTPDVSIVHLRLPIGRRIPFRAGQYAKVLFEDGDSRNYSLANPPQDNDVAQLHVRRLPGGRFSDAMLGQLERGDHLHLEMPYGVFTLSEDDDVPAIMIATGTGLSSLRSMIVDLARRHASRKVHLFWGDRTEADLYDLPRLSSWQRRHSWLQVTPVLSRAASAWCGATGRVQDAVIAAYPDLSGHEVYACGNPAMISEARALLVGRAGLADERFHADPFVPSAEPASMP